MKKNQSSNNNDKSNLSSARSESSKKTSVSDDVVNILELKYETETSFEYLKDNTGEFLNNFSNVFASDLKEFFNYIVSEEENNIDYNLLSKQILISSGNIFSFFDKYNDLYNFWFNLLFNSINLNNIKLQQIKFFKRFDEWI